ncbi:hypothetical protein T01_2904 [Trichinella spiralis]|uniref:Uncharacterized protein n=1 Tax=Trichinella spiralis TaxID=6334 RepID=A0A0V1B912_TRISP|nr:hypothetical protein T01_2904 [Trichinella spiralis]
MSRGDPGGNNSLRTALYTHSLALAACCEDGTPVTTKKSSIDWSHSMGSIPGENVRGPHCNEPLSQAGSFLASTGMLPRSLPNDDTLRAHVCVCIARPVTTGPAAPFP